MLLWNAHQLLNVLCMITGLKNVIQSEMKQVQFGVLSLYRKAAGETLTSAV